MREWAERVSERSARDLLGARAADVAPLLLGARVTSSVGGVDVTVRLTEVEAYEGADDPASHAFRGQTERNAVMFGPAGFLYVYFVYGMHWCANVVCGPAGVASAVLLRAGEVVDGDHVAAGRRPAARRPAELARGPARLAQALGLTRADNGTDLLAPDSTVRLELRTAPTPAWTVGPRVGVAVAAEAPLRFWLPGEPSVSVYRPALRRRGRPGGQT
jgi:DNA-3-methyladenine glycosylase